MARQNFVGVVVSQGKMQKTIKVRIQQPTFNKLINKQMLDRKDYLVHDEGEVCREGDLVRIEATRPLSRRKFFAVAEILKNKGQKHAQYEKEAKTLVAQEEHAKTLEFLKQRKIYKDNVENKSSLLDDLLFLDEVAGLSEQQMSEQMKAKKDSLVEKYQINSWPDYDFTKLGISSLRGTVAGLKTSIGAYEDVDAKITEILANEELTDSILTKMGKTLPVKGNIKRNLIRKYVLSSEDNFKQEASA